MSFIIANPTEDPEELKRRLTEMVSDDDITRYLGEEGHNNIIKYSEIKNYKDIDKLIPSFNSYKIILIENEFNSGHWTCLLKYKIDNKPTIEWFNSYGMRPSADLNFISKYMNKILGQGYNDFDELLDNTTKNYNIIYNKKRFQSTNKKVNTCGRWCLLRIIMMIHYGMDLYEFIKFIDELKDKYDTEADVICAMLTP